MQSEPAVEANDAEDDVSERDAIIEAAFSSLSEPHTGAVTLAAVLARAGLSTRAFYRHFESKDALFLAMMRGEGDSLARRLDRIAERFDGPPSDQLRVWLGQIFGLLQDARLNMHMTVLDSDEVRAAKGYRAAREQWHDDRERSLAAILRRGLEDGSFPLARPEQDAIAIGAVVSHAMSRLCSDGECEVAQVEVVDFALRAVGADTRCGESGGT
ncbi:TetR/AcrR family transcriptional regulator [Mycolicibacterium sp. 050232]|uniref:TetR/AcrR family transcriptional regulator n=1 Tax=Mycolicibacterium sp. 050232 TaxID=3113982 RepID=UPI002E28BAAD|nr:TetR/AcrR family transcriptional regulator [Mycolicibacterium sp. 050232]MED5814012.1 TetR/AcrR family transcriptional regulator [Mycolicibacterium sp. 050232]